MEGLLIFGALGIYLLISNLKLKKRITALEAKFVAKLSDLIEPASEAAPVSRPDITTQDFKPKKTSVPASFSASSKASNNSSETLGDAASKPKSAYVDKLTAFITWLVQNWFYAVAAVSLALAGIFLVQYGMERGLLPPGLRVLAALGFGTALIFIGEYLRRRFGDGENVSTAYLPSTFSSAGIVTLFAAVLSARLLYGFIGPELTFLGMALIGAVALLLGWFYGPLLAAIGIIGAMIAPFVVGGTSEDPSWLLSYFALVTAIGLAIDTMRRWAWISVMSLVLGFVSATLLVSQTNALIMPYFIIYCAFLAIISIAIPSRKLMPDHQGAMASEAIFTRKKNGSLLEFPTMLAGGSLLACCGLIVLTLFEASRIDVFWTGLVVLAALTLLLLIWARNAKALTDLAPLPALGLVAVIATNERLWRVISDAAINVEAGTEATLPVLPSVIVAIGIAISVVAAWRSLKNDANHIYLAAGAAIFAPLLAVTMEVVWQPANMLGALHWAIHAMVLSVLMVAMAERFARADGPENRLRMSFPALSALACIAFGVTILFSSAALTFALVVTVVAAAWLDRQFNLPIMGLYILAGIVSVGYRLVVDPGLNWAEKAPLAEVLLSYAGAVAGFAIALILIRSLKRPRSQIFLESALFSATGLLGSVVLYRVISALDINGGGMNTISSHWNFGLGATIWIMLGIAQLKRLEAGGGLAIIRKILGGLFLVFGLFQLSLAATLFNPALDLFSSKIIGPALFNTLTPAYLLPAILLLIGGFWLTEAPKRLRQFFYAFAIAAAALWLTLTIRHFWLGTEGMAFPIIKQSELYSYTVALLTIGATLFYQSLARQNTLLRKAGLLVIGIAVAKVFLVDISGLGGLIRVFSLLLLGAALAGLAWLNRWAIRKYQDSDGKPNPN